MRKITLFFLAFLFLFSGLFLVSERVQAQNVILGFTWNDPIPNQQIYRTCGTLISDGTIATAVCNNDPEVTFLIDFYIPTKNTDTSINPSTGVEHNMDNCPYGIEEINGTFTDAQGNPQPRNTAYLAGSNETCIGEALSIGATQGAGAVVWSTGPLFLPPNVVMGPVNLRLYSATFFEAKNGSLFQWETLSGVRQIAIVLEDCGVCPGDPACQCPSGSIGDPATGVDGICVNASTTQVPLPTCKTGEVTDSNNTSGVCVQAAQVSLQGPTLCPAGSLGDPNTGVDGMCVNANTVQLPFTANSCPTGAGWVTDSNNASGVCVQANTVQTSPDVLACPSGSLGDSDNGVNGVCVQASTVQLAPSLACPTGAGWITDSNNTSGICVNAITTQDNITSSCPTGVGWITDSNNTSGVCINANAPVNGCRSLPDLFSAVQYCCSGVCSDVNCNPSCTSSSQCSAGQYCCGGVCSNTSCSSSCTSDSQCSAGQYCCGGFCSNTKCTFSCTSDSQCSAGQYCCGGVCTNTNCNSSCTSSSQCSAGQYCCSGVCSDINDPNCSSPCTSSSQCPEGQYCCSHICSITKCSSSCTSDSQCSAGQYCCGGVCSNTSCSSSCTSGLDCSAGQFCCNGFCSITSCKQSCTSDSQCSAGQYCCKGICSITKCSSSCASSSDCSAGQYCCGGVCSDIDCNPPCNFDSQLYAHKYCCSNICSGVTCGQPPSADSLSSSEDDCDSGPEAGSVSFTWNYDGVNPESEFIFQVADNSSFNPRTIDYDTGQIYFSNTSNSQSATVLVSPSAGQLAYNTKYYWRVKVYDNQNLNSGWVKGATFTTPPHYFPSPVITFAPPSPLVNQCAQFQGSSTCYDTPAYTWTFDDNTQSNDQNPACRKYTSPRTYLEILKVCDKEGQCCLTSKNLVVKPPIGVPTWKEISPF